MATKYGIVSDIHMNPELVRPVLERLGSEGIDNLVLLGDCGNDELTVAYVLNETKELGKDTFVVPGNHETLRGFYAPMQFFGSQSSHLVDCTQNPKIEKGDHDLVFLPGSNWLCGGEFKLVDDSEIETGNYPTPYGPRRVINMNDLRNFVTHPDKTIVMSHAPRRFYHSGKSVDEAYFAELMDGSGLIPGMVLENQIRQETGEQDYEKISEIARTRGYILKNEKSGNVSLAELYNELGIRKAINGHFHESVGVAHDADGRAVAQGELVDELFWNASYNDAGKFGILTVDGEKAGYQNLDLA